MEQQVSVAIPTVFGDQSIVTLANCLPVYPVSLENVSVLQVAERGAKGVKKRCGRSLISEIAACTPEAQKQAAKTALATSMA